MRKRKPVSPYRMRLSNSRSSTVRSQANLASPPLIIEKEKITNMKFITNYCYPLDSLAHSFILIIISQSVSYSKV